MLAWTIEADIASGNFDPTLEKYRTNPNPVSFSAKPEKPLELLELWQRYCDYREPQVAVTTFKKDYLTRYANCVKSLPSQKLSDAIAVRDFLVKNLSNYASKRMLTQLSACCKWAVKSELIPRNPFEGMAEEIKISPKSASDINPFSVAERDAIIQAFETHPVYCHYTNFVKFLFMTGCRTGEAIGLQWKHVNKGCTQIAFCESYSRRYGRKDTKTHKARKFPCNQSLQSLLLGIRPKDYVADDFVFTSLTGLPISNEGFLSDVWRGCKRHGKPHKGIVSQLALEGKIEGYRPQYNTRHTFITLALDNGLDVKDVARLVGNAPEIIYRYYAGSSGNLVVPEF